jgi:hypothetical protein
VDNERTAELPPDVVDLAEVLAERLGLGAGAGDTRLELIYDNGVLRFVWLHSGPVDRHKLRKDYRAA